MVIGVTKLLKVGEDDGSGRSMQLMPWLFGPRPYMLSIYTAHQKRDCSIGIQAWVGLKGCESALSFDEFPDFPLLVFKH